MDINKIPPRLMPYMQTIPATLYHTRVSGQYYGAFGACGPTTSAGAAMVVDKIYAVPFIVLTTETFNVIGIDVATLAAGKARMGVYGDNNCAPGALLLGTGEVDTGTTGAKLVAINLTLEPGLYWLAAIFSGTPKVMGPTATVNILGIGGVSVAAGSCATGYYTTQAYGALPDPHPAPVPVSAYLGGTVLGKA